MLGTIMAANVFFMIIPAHWELVRAKQEGREPNPLPGLRAKQRSVHNNYLTLPVVFTMLAGHFPLTFGSDHAWLVLLAIFALVAAIRHFFNLWHPGRRAWWILAAVGVGAVALAVALAPEDAPAGSARRTTPPSRSSTERCQACHSGPRRRSGSARDGRAAARARGRDRAQVSRARCRPGTRPA